MGSDSDLPVMESAARTLGRFRIPFELKICSAHRSLHATLDYAKSAEARGIRVIIAGAGGAAHLAGVIAGQTTLPVIGVGGIFDADDAKRMLDAGARLVQLYTGIVYRGPGLVREIARLKR